MTSTLQRQHNPHRSPRRARAGKARQGTRRDSRRGVRRSRRARPPLHQDGHFRATTDRGGRPCAAVGVAIKNRVGARHRVSGYGQDLGEHGDRPQRDARPMGLDERSRYSFLGVGLGHRLDRGGVEALAQLHPPHLSPIFWARTRISATRSCGSIPIRNGTRAIWGNLCTTCCSRCCSSGASRCTTWISRRSGPGRSRGRRCVRT